MAYKHNLDVQVKVEGILYQLVEDPSTPLINCCNKCAFEHSFCNVGNCLGLQNLCSINDKYEQTYFEEVIW